MLKRKKVQMFILIIGNVVFTLLMVIGLVFTQDVWAFPTTRPVFQTASTNVIAYQGKLADASSNALTGDYDMTFKFYNVASGGIALWTETWNGANQISVSSGLFSVMLGSITAIPNSVITDNDTLYLGITVGSDSEMIPRTQLGSVPFATQSQNVVSVPSGNVVSNVQTAQNAGEKSVVNNSYIDILSISVNLSKASTLRVNYHSLVWKTAGSGRVVLGIRLDGSANTIPDNLVLVGAPNSSGWVADSLFLGDTTFFVNVPTGSHTLTLVLGSWDGGTAHSRESGMSVETLKQ